MRISLLPSISFTLFGLAIAPLAFAQSTPLPKANEAQNDASALVEETQAPEIDFIFDESPDDHVIGSETAPLTMISYASVTCGHCGNWFSNEWPDIREALVETGKLRFVLRPLPTPPAILSMTGFIMGECAPDEDYFEVIQYQMENQTAIFEAAQAGQGQEAYAKVGALAGLNSDEEINACLSDPTHMSALQRAGARADAANVQGVPAFYVNGETYKGKQDAATIIALIEEMTEKGLSSLPEIENIESSDKEDSHDH